MGVDNQDILFNNFDWELVFIGENVVFERSENCVQKMVGFNLLEFANCLGSLDAISK